jgi:type VI secretion system protein VasD
MNKTSLNFAVLASAVGVLGACAHPQPPSPCTTPEPVRVLLTASPRLNPGDNGESLATTVRIYQLKDTAKLVESSIDRLLDGDRGILGEDLVSVQELILYPGEKAAPAMVRGEGATSLAVVAMFRHPVVASHPQAAATGSAALSRHDRCPGGPGRVPVEVHLGR